MADPFAPEPYLTDIQPLLAAALARDGGVVERPRPRQVAYRPHRSITIAYDARVGWGRQRPCADRVVVRAARRPIPGHAPAAEDEHGHPVHVFPAAHDPGLPGLRRALDRRRVSDLLADLGLGERGAGVRLGLRSYRPLRRAVVEAAGRGGRLFLKVVPPAHIEGLHQRHRLLEDALPVPRSAGFTDDGIVVLGALPGRTMRDVLLSRGPVPGLGEVTALLDRLPSGLADLAAAPPAGDRVAEYVTLLSALVPEAAARLQGLAAAIAELRSRRHTEPVPVHGDLYEGQLLVQGGAITGLLDVDGTGGGLRVDDLANMIGHLSVLGRARRSRRCEQIGSRWMAELDRSGRFDPTVLRAEVAAVVLGLATGCFRVQERGWPERTFERIELVEAWVRSAERAAEAGEAPRSDERGLSAGSRRSQARAPE